MHIQKEDTNTWGKTFTLGRGLGRRARKYPHRVQPKLKPSDDSHHCPQLSLTKSWAKNTSKNCQWYEHSNCFVLKSPIQNADVPSLVHKTTQWTTINTGVHTTKHSFLRKMNKERMKTFQPEHSMYEEETSNSNANRIKRTLETSRSSRKSDSVQWRKTLRHWIADTQNQKQNWVFTYMLRCWKCRNNPVLRRW